MKIIAGLVAALLLGGGAEVGAADERWWADLPGFADIERGEFPQLLDAGATVICFDEAGEVLDVVRIGDAEGDDPPIASIEFHRPDPERQIHVIAVGPRVAEKNRAHVAGTYKDGNLDHVHVRAENGIVNFLGAERHASSFTMIESARMLELRDVLQAAVEHEAADRPAHRESTRIVHEHRYRRHLVEDEDGNRRPPEMTPELSAFLTSTVEAYVQQDLAYFQKHTHKLPEGDFVLPLISDRVLEGALTEHYGAMDRFELVRIDPAHPDDRVYAEIETPDGLSARWRLTIFFADAEGDGVVSLNFAIGEQDGAHRILVQPHPTRRPRP